MKPPFVLNSQLHVALFPSPLAEELQRHRFPEPLTTYSPPCTCDFSSKIQNFKFSRFCSTLGVGPFVYFPKIQESICLGYVKNLTA